MSASEQPKSDPQREPEADEARRPVGQQSNGAREIPQTPLFLRDSSDGRKGNAQDEKDEVGE